MPFSPPVDLSNARQHHVSLRHKGSDYNAIVEDLLVGPSTPPSPEEGERGRQPIISSGCHGHLSCRSPRTEPCADDQPSGSEQPVVVKNGIRLKQSGETRRWWQRAAGVLLLAAGVVLALSGQLREGSISASLLLIYAEQPLLAAMFTQPCPFKGAKWPKSCHLPGLETALHCLQVEKMAVWVRCLQIRWLGGLQKCPCPHYVKHALANVAAWP